jgi:hypothetical protein
LPSLAPGLADAEAVTSQVRELSHGLFEAPGAHGRLITDETKLGVALHRALAPDIATAAEIGFVHRKLDFADIYFLVNTSNHPVHHAAVFRVTRGEPEWWDHFTGAVAKAGNGPRLDLELAPYESRVVVFARERLKEARTPLTPVPASVNLIAPQRGPFHTDSPG